MLSRRDFLRRTSIALAGGLIVGDTALEMFERLTHRKMFGLGAMPGTTLYGLSTATYQEWDAAYMDTAGGRFSARKLRRAIQAIRDQRPEQVFAI